jgi:hypothetical protein
MAMVAMQRACLLLIAGLGAAACSRTFETTVVQPNPLISPSETLRDSEKAVIITGDMDLEMPEQPGPSKRVALLRNHLYPLHNEASWTMVSRDRLRFHVQLEHKWEEWADVGSWEVYLVDDGGHRYQPESIEHARTKMLVQMWDREIRTARRNMYGDIVALNEDGWKNRQTLGSLAVFRGNADFVFYKRNIFTRDLRWVRLVVRRPGTAFEFQWNFEDGEMMATSEKDEPELVDGDRDPRYD